MLKQLIQRLLDSRTTAAEAAHSAMPKPETPTIVSDPVTDKTWHSLIAPFDGYFSCKGITKHMLIENSAAQWSGVTGLTSGGYMGFTLPMSKGSEVRYQLDHNSTGVIMTFSKTIGGGYNCLVRRALSCLRPSFNYLPKVFLRAKNSGLAVKHSLKQLLHWMFRHVPSLHHLMGILDTSTLSAVEANSCSIWIRVKKYLAVKSLVIAGFLQQTPTVRQQYLSRKAVLLLLLPTRCSVKFGLLRLQARHNLQTGGALC